MSPEVHPLLDLHARCHHKWGGSGDIQETEKGNCLLNISWQNNLIAKHHRILKIYNRICWRHLCWRPPPCSWSHRQLGPEGLPLLSSRSFTMIVLPRVTMTSITSLGRHVLAFLKQCECDSDYSWGLSIISSSRWSHFAKLAHAVTMMSLSWESWKELFSEKKREAKKDTPPVEEGGHLQGWYRPGPTDRAGRLHGTLQPGEHREKLGASLFLCFNSLWMCFTVGKCLK